jgi:hypothetical protein
MVPSNLNSLRKYLLDKSYDVKLQEQTHQLYIIFVVHNREFPLFFRLDEDSHLLQLILFMPCIMSPRAPSDIGRLLHLLNKEMDLPGFGMDEQANVIFYRQVIPKIKKQIDTENLDIILSSLPQIARVFYPLIASVSSAGGLKFEVIAEQVKEALKQFKSQ